MATHAGKASKALLNYDWKLEHRPEPLFPLGWDVLENAFVLGLGRFRIRLLTKYNHTFGST